MQRSRGSEDDEARATGEEAGLARSRESGVRLPTCRDRSRGAECVVCTVCMYVQNEIPTYVRESVTNDCVL
jgi:hypothetical protein